jgi:ATP-dependent DNA helicase RecG
MPVHAATEDLRPQKIREWVEQVVGWAPNAIEGLPAEMRARRGLAGVGDALTGVQLPRSIEDVEGARERLGFEELFLHQALLATRKRTHRTARPAPRFGKPGDLVARWLDSLPFEPTGDQLKAFDEIEVDLDSGEPMQRLLMGEVGSGKTVVAVYSMLRALEAGYQAALMAPTETLAEQHAITLGRLLAEEAIPFSLLTGSTPAPVRRRALNQLASGELGLILGTHALIEPTVRFARLGLVVVDEQHRFGVSQRRALDEKGVEGMAPHVLHMTATPIPRTLSLTEYGDLDTTALHELPAGRQPISTHLVTEEQRGEAFEFLRRQLREGRQAFVVCPLVGESEKVAGKAAAVEAERLRSGELRDFRIGLLHGQMHSNDKAEAMRAFAAQETDVLVSTTVIEVGIDVANATVMVIEGAERFGVSQLHQLRGRVGRGEHPSQCLLFAEEAGELAQKRLAAVAGESDGFKLAEIDLELRGAGEILGTRQSGLPRFAVAKLPEDGPLLMEAHREVLVLLRDHGSLADPALGPLLDAAHRRFGTGAADPIPLSRRSSFVGYRPIKDERRIGCGDESHRRGAQRPAPGRAARLEGAPDLRPGPRGDLLRARRAGRGSPRPRPLLRHRGAGDRGALARRRAGRPGRSRHPSGARQRAAARARRAGRARPRRRRSLAGAGFVRPLCGEIRPRLRRCPL